MDGAGRSQFQFPADFDSAMAAIRAFNLLGLEFRPCNESVVAYAKYERVPADFPRPDNHIVIIDYLIALPVVAVDVSPASEHYGRVVGYCGGDYWIPSSSLSELAARLQ